MNFLTYLLQILLYVFLSSCIVSPVAIALTETYQFDPNFVQIHPNTALVVQARKVSRTGSNNFAAEEVGRLRFILRGDVDLSCEEVAADTTVQNKEMILEFDSGQVIDEDRGGVSTKIIPFDQVTKCRSAN